jgi:hypothetical protein
VYRGSKPPVPKQAKPGKPASQSGPSTPVRGVGRGTRVALVGVVLVVAGALGWQFVRGRPSEPAAATTPAAPATADPAVLALDRLSDSVSISLRGFGNSERQFAAHQIDCPALAEGLAQVEAAWVSYSIVKRRAVPLDATRQSRDQTLDASVDSVDRNFDRTGCPRP